MDENITILQSKKKLLYLITYNAILIVISILMIIFSNLLQVKFLVILARIFAGVFIFVFGYNIISLVLQLKNPKEIFSITSDGIIDNTNFAIFNNIKWDEIKSIDIINKEFNTKNEIYTKKFIGIDLNNIDDIISISDDFIKERINNNIKNFGKHIIIDLGNADCDMDKVYNVLKDRFESFK